jgi:hypothetical protein
VNTVAKFASQPQQPHYLAVACIFRYLVGTINLSICYSSQAGSPLSQSLEAYSDADYAGDIIDRKSRSGSILMVNGTPIVWSNRKQACVATSTTESEYIAASSIAKDVIWIRRLCADLGFAQIIPTCLLLDN